MNTLPLEKICTNCKRTKARYEFKPKTGGRYVTPYCFTCAPEVKRRYYEKSKAEGTHQNGHYKRVFGITLEDYRNMFEKQEGLCAICQNPQLTKMLAVDHDHISGEIRGLLCDKCNWALGAMKDNIKTLNNAINYLAKWSHK